MPGAWSATRITSAMFFVAILLALFCLAVGHMHGDLAKLLLAGAWVTMAAATIGSLVYSVCFSLFS